MKLLGIMDCNVKKNQLAGNKGKCLVLSKCKKWSCSLWRGQASSKDSRKSVLTANKQSKKTVRTQHVIVTLCFLYGWNKRDILCSLVSFGDTGRHIFVSSHRARPAVSAWIVAISISSFYFRILCKKANKYITPLTVFKNCFRRTSKVFSQISYARIFFLYYNFTDRSLHLGGNYYNLMQNNVEPIPPAIRRNSPLSCFWLQENCRAKLSCKAQAPACGSKGTWLTFPKTSGATARA